MQINQVIHIMHVRHANNAGGTDDKNSCSYNPGQFELFDLALDFGIPNRMNDWVSVKGLG